MRIDELNRRFGAPGRIVFRDGFAGYPNVVLAGKYGTAEVALLGANVLAYRPTGHGPVLARPARTDYNRGESCHGGIPLCWPQFGNRFSKDLPQHGFARLMVFEVRGTEYSDEMTEVTLGLKSDAETRKLWPHDFDLELKVSVSMKLNLTLVTRNVGTEPFDFSCAFHPYFTVRNRDDVVVRGLDGAPYVDASSPELREGVQRGDFRVDFAADHVFAPAAAPKHEFALLDPGLRRAIALAAAGAGRLVVWNCGPDAVPADLGPEDWRKYVCVEPVSCWPGGQTLAAGEKHTLMMAVQAHLEEVK